MPAPKEQGRNPISKGIKFNKKFGWVYYEHFNQDNVPDRMEYFNTEEEAKARLEQ